MGTSPALEKAATESAGAWLVLAGKLGERGHIQECTTFYGLALDLARGLGEDIEDRSESWCKAKARKMKGSAI
jgi:hypothetical protein